MTKKIGVIVGREQTWPAAFIDTVNRRNEDVVAEFVKLGGTRMAELSAYDVIIDRISHEIPYYRTFLKTAVIAGTVVINNPFWWSADDKFIGATIAKRIGVAHPRSVALPTHSYIDGVVPEESLRNLIYPIPWEEHIEYVGGFPLILKPVWGGGFKSVYKVYNIEQLWSAYNETGITCMMLQEYIDWEKYARCICVGKDNILVTKFDIHSPWPHRYFDDPDFLTSEEHNQVVDGSRKLCHTLGYDMNAVEFAIKDGIAYAIDFTNPAPDFEYYSLKDTFFTWVVETMADYCITRAKTERIESNEIVWQQLLRSPSQP